MDEAHELPHRLRIFLCHSSGDKEKVRYLCWQLRESGFKTWLDEDDLLPGEDWEAVIAAAVRESDVVLICLSRASVNKAGFVQREIKFALDVAEQQPENTIYLIPVKLEACDVPERLRRWHWVDLHEDKGYERLVRALERRTEALRDVQKLAGSHASIASPQGKLTSTIVGLQTSPSGVAGMPSTAHENVLTERPLSIKTKRGVIETSDLSNASKQAVTVRLISSRRWLSLITLGILVVGSLMWFVLVNAPAELKPALDDINRNDLLQHIRMLSSDEFEGRAPNSRGEELSIEYLTKQFQLFGLKPGNPDGTFVQKVSLVGFTADPTASFTVSGKQLKLDFPQDYVAVSRRFVPESKVENSEMVFVGYGVEAPEYGWDDYKGLDVRGKTIVMLINDPQIPDSADPTKLDDKMFKGKAMTYYGRWTYKYEIAAQKGAAAAVIIHETGPAGYPYEVVSGSWSRENFDIQTPDKNMGRAAVESWITTGRARELFTASGQDFDALKKAALSKNFKPIALNAKANMSVKNTLREINSNNVIGKLEGSDPTLKNEYVIYTAHWDHLGRDPELKGDQIFNGAVDNAAGTAALLEIAEAFTKLATSPKRSILFLAVTAQEKGLLGAKYYAENPLYPLTKTLANINMDGVNQWGRTADITMIGDDNSTLIDLLRETAKVQARKVKPDPDLEKGYYYRSDHFEFAKAGVPALYIDSGIDYVTKGTTYIQIKRDEYVINNFHKVSDEIKPDWDLAGAVEDAQLLMMIGYRVAQSDKYPEWKLSSEFKTKRSEMMNVK